MKNIAPMLANNGTLEIHRQKHNRAIERVLKRAAKGARKATKKIKFEIDPDIAISFRPISKGKVNQLYRTLNSISQINSI